MNGLNFIQNAICKYIVAKEIVFHFERVTDEQIEYWKEMGWLHD